MKTSKLDDGEILRRLCDALAESVADLPDAEVLAEAREAGEDPATVAQELRAAAFGALKSLRQEKLRAAREEYEIQHARLAASRTSLPATAAARRRLLDSAMKSRPELRELTVAARELRALPDEDVESLLRQLDALGALPLPLSRPRYRHASWGWRWGWRAAALAVAVILFIGGFLAGARRPRAVLTKTENQLYVLLLREDADFRPPAGVPIEARAHEYGAWAQELRRQGHLVLEERLATSGWLLKVGRPLAELPGVKEGAQVSGLFMIRSSSEAQALAISRSCPHLRYGGWVELRHINPT